MAKSLILNSDAKYSVCPGKLKPADFIDSLFIGRVTIASIPPLLTADTADLRYSN